MQGHIQDFPLLSLRWDERLQLRHCNCVLSMSVWVCSWALTTPYTTHSYNRARSKGTELLWGQILFSYYINWWGYAVTTTIWHNNYKHKFKEICSHNQVSLAFFPSLQQNLMQKHGSFKICNFLVMSKLQMEQHTLVLNKTIPMIICATASL